MSGQSPPPPPHTVFGCVKAQESMLGMLMSTNLKKAVWCQTERQAHVILSNSQGKNKNGSQVRSVCQG